MDQHSLLLLLNEYLNGNCSEDESSIVKSWYQSFKDQNTEVADLDEHELQAIGERIFQQILIRLKEKREI
ncbi:hypothetical protein SAMN05421821_119104 [Mucilaginibacter lappiensis]|uniref:Uncharacterized protein n=1 Tax=Mucilaginibacter lappiensis TaxID=354630 RepID=A0ABR6PS10_9SPHI|nr:hypothetical protein [Mucilaginibacter lappiensis]MBB6112568.1 hypothetical protein [Mucilaginibacter lappiensis]SIS03227.1 hypothetical protein SAMN05421821_119104 [Mucilaginibacter lappiensis]